MIVNIVVNGDTEVIAKFKSMPSAVHAALLQKVYALSLKLEAHVKKNKLSGQVLSRKSGRLIRSIGSRVLDTGASIFGIVFQSGDVPYGAIHEFGGKTGAHLIVPKKAAVLAFLGKAGGTVFARKVNHPGSQFPSRSYMRSSLRDMSTEISLGMKEAIVKGAQAHMGGRA